MAGKHQTEGEGPCIPWERFHESPLGTLQSEHRSHSRGLLGSAPSSLLEFLLEFCIAEPDGEAREGQCLCFGNFPIKIKGAGGKANTVEGQAKMEKTAFYGRSY